MLLSASRAALRPSRHSLHPSASSSLRKVLFSSAAAAPQRCARLLRRPPPALPLLGIAVSVLFSSLLPGPESSSVAVCAAAPYVAPAVVVVPPPSSFLCRLSYLRRSFVRYFRALLRLLRVTATLLPLSVLAPATLVLPSPFLRDVTWRYATFSIQSLGPAFIKLAQWAATRRDLFPVSFCSRLSVMHANSRTHEWHHTHRTLQDAFGSNYGAMLRVDDKTPLVGSGAVAQVYKGCLRDGTAVAVKVIHPDLKEVIENDLMIMDIVANLIDKTPFLKLKWFGLPEAVAEFKVIMEEQLDLTKEAANLTKFRRNFEDYGIGSGRVVFPRPIPSLVTSDVLVETFEEGVGISSFFDESTEIRRTLARPLVRSFLQMVFSDNLIHCDLHPGNVLVRPNPLGNKGAPYTLVLLDAGIVVKLSEKDEKNLRDLFTCVVLNEGERAGRLIVARARRESCSAVPGGPEAFASSVGSIVSEFHDNRSKGLTLGAVKIGQLMAQILDLCRTHGVLLEPAMANVVLSTLVLEGLGRTLDEDMNLMDAAMPFILQRRNEKRR